MLRLLQNTSSCSTIPIPQIISFVLIILEVLIAPLFICLDRCQFQKALKTYSTSYKPDLQISEIKDSSITECNEVSNKQKCFNYIKTTHLLISLKTSSHLERLATLLIYINSLIIQLGFILFLFSTKNNSYFNTIIIGLISSSVSGILTYTIFSVKMPNSILQKIMYFVDYALTLACLCNIFFRDPVCSYGLWLYAYIGSVAFDLFVIQTLLVCGRKFFSVLYTPIQPKA